MSHHTADRNRNVTAGSSFLSLEPIWRDIRFAVRSLLKAPGFTVIAILVIAIGIGANTAVFSVINTVLLKPLTYPDPQSLVHLIHNSDGGSFNVANVPKFNIWQQQTGIFQKVAAYDTERHCAENRQSTPDQLVRSSRRRRRFVRRPPGAE